MPVATVLCLLAAACGEPRPEKHATVPVSGTVRYRGKPVCNASVVFQAADGSVAPNGWSEPDGFFALSTYGHEDGAPPGTYTVTVAAAVPREIAPGVLPAEPKGGFPSPLPVKYADPDTSGIVLEVTEQGKNEFLIELK
jgi:hypothetical protein